MLLLVHRQKYYEKKNFRADSLLAFERRRHCFARSLQWCAKRMLLLNFFFFFFSWHGKSKLDSHINLSVGR